MTKHPQLSFLYNVFIFSLNDQATAVAVAMAMSRRAAQ